MKVSSQKPGFKHLSKGCSVCGQVLGVNGWSCHPPVALLFARNYCPFGGTAKTSMSWLLSSCTSCCGQGKVPCTLPPPITAWSSNGQEKSQQLRWEREGDQCMELEPQKLVVNKSTNPFQLNCWIWAVGWGFFSSSETTCACTYIQRNSSYLRRQRKWKPHSTANNNGWRLL